MTSSRGRNVSSRLNRTLLPDDELAVLQTTQSGAPGFEQTGRRAPSPLRMRLPLIAFVAVTGAILAFAIALLLPPAYTAKAQLLIEPQQKPIDFVGEQSGGARQAENSNPPPNLVDTHIATLTAHDFLARVVADLERASNPPPNGPVRNVGPAANAPGPAVNGASEVMLEAGPLSLREIERRVKLWLSALTKVPQGDAPKVRDFEKAVKVTQEGHSDVVTVAFTAASPAEAAASANRIVEMFAASRADEKRASLRQQLNHISGQIALLKLEADHADGAARSIINRQTSGNYNGGGGRFEYQRMREVLTEAAGSRQLLPALERRQSYLRNAAASAQSDARVLSLASAPDRPNSINPFLLAGPALIIFALAGNWLGAFLQKRDRRIRSERDVMDLLDIPCAGLAPLLPRKVVNGQYRQLFNTPTSPFTQAIKSIAGMLRSPRNGEAAQVVMITSSIAGEGKTTLGVSLGVFAALLGRRVLIVDFSCARGRIQKKLLKTQCDAERAGAPAPIDSIHHAYDLGLDYLFLGHRPVDFPDPFGGEHFSTLLGELRERYDYIFLDCPPLLGVADAPLLSRFTDLVLFVIKWESAKQVENRNALELLRRAGCNNAVAVLTQVNLKEHARYNFGDFSEYLLKHQRAIKSPPLTTADITSAFRGILTQGGAAEKHQIKPPPLTTADITSAFRGILTQGGAPEKHQIKLDAAKPSPGAKEEAPVTGQSKFAAVTEGSG